MKHSFEGPLTPEQEILTELVTLVEKTSALTVPHFTDDGGIDPVIVAIIHQGGGYKSVVMPIRLLFQDDLEEKRPEILRTLFRTLGCRYYVMVTEAWVREVPQKDKYELSDEEIYEASRTLPRRSSLLVSGEDIYGNYASRMTVIVNREATGENHTTLCNRHTDTEDLPKGRLIGLLEGEISDDPRIKLFAVGVLALLKNEF
jgi:uncharacterized protein YndB with AHSA1/START domain